MVRVAVMIRFSVGDYESEYCDDIYVNDVDELTEEYFKDEALEIVQSHCFEECNIEDMKEENEGNEEVVDEANVEIEGIDIDYIDLDDVEEEEQELVEKLKAFLKEAFNYSKEEREEKNKEMMKASSSFIDAMLKKANE